MRTADLVFLDTNILVYQFDRNDKEKQSQAIELIKQCILEERVVISSQVVQEIASVALKKFDVPMSPIELKGVMDKFLKPLCAHFPSFDFYERVITLYANDTIEFYDAMIIQAALDLRCKTIYSEDMQNGRKFGGLIIRNPFI